MAFGGGSGFSFGNNNQSSTFGSGGFGSNTNTSSGFGSGTTFGPNSNSTSSNPFGSGGGSTFGNSGGGFGSSSNTGTGLFGNKPSAFGSNTNTNTSTSLFGNTNNSTNTTGFGSSSTPFGGNTSGGGGGAFGSGSSTTGGGFGFGASNTNNNNTTAFGSSQNKPLFGQGGSGTTTAFGGSGGAFGNSGTALSGSLPPCPGTAEVAFQPVSEKETNGTTSNYQTITFMQPYQKYSLEELRLADYAAGRQFGNAAGGTGAFGQTNFGSSFGNTNNTTGGVFGSSSGGGGLFGNTTSASTGFGSNTATAGGFGTSTTGGLFGNKPASGGLFGQQTSSSTTGGLFSTTNNNNNSTGGFGFGQNNQQPSTGGLFGNNNNQQAKPTGLFGNTPSATTGGFSFGSNNQQQQNTNQGSGLFGNTATNPPTGGLFGANNNQQATNTGGGLFGNNNQASGGLFGNKPGGFGASTTQNQPSGGLFGNNNNTSGGLFGNQQQQNTQPGGLFGNTNTGNQGGGLFGQSQNKPGGLFANTNNNTGGGLFGNANNNQTQPGGGLFGNANAGQTNTGGGLFGNAGTNTGGGLFSQNNQNKPGGLFGNTNANNNQSTGLFNNSLNSGLFGQSQNNQQQVQNQQEVKHASLLDPNPYGQSSIWTGLPNPTPENSKPIFTPLTATKKLEESARKPLPSMRLNQSRYMTPPRRNGYGFSYSTYGTPSSASSTPGGVSLNNSLYGSRGWSGGSFGKSFNRSASVQNLRSQYTSDADDIWKPNAFAPSHRNSSGSIKRLTIDRSIRQDLFNRPASVPALPAPKSTANGETNTPSQVTDSNTDHAKKLSKRVSFENVQETELNSETGALQRIEDSDSEDSPPLRPSGASNVELQSVPEDRESHQVSSKSLKASPTADPTPGDYWMKPSRQELAKIPREQLKAFKGFQVGRAGCGFVSFDGTVDLTAIDLSELYEKIVQIRVRSVTVYPDPGSKPPVGRGLNVPSTITIDNSWPRSRGKPVSDTSGPVFDKHINRLKKIPGTEFVSYAPTTGRWVFKVPHYTRYGLDYDDDEQSMMDQSELSLPPQSVEKSADASVMEVDDQTDSNDEDDTFAFRKSVPGQFGKQSIIPIDEDTELQSDHDQQDDGSEHSAFSEDDMLSDDEPSPQMPGSLPQVSQPSFISPSKAPPKQVAPGTPGKPLLDLEGDWAEQLQRTISPRKQNRDVLREVQNKVLLDQAFSPIKPKAAPHVNFRSSIDIMNSMFKSTKKQSGKANDPDFEFPYSKRSKLFHPNDEEMSEQDRLWHQSFKPHFTTNGDVIYKTSKLTRDKTWKEVPIAGDEQALVVAGHQQVDKGFNIDAAVASSRFDLKNGIPAVRHSAVPFSQLASQIEDKNIASIYNLAHILFDDFEDEFTQGLSPPLQKKFMHRIRKDRLSQYLTAHIMSAMDADSIAATEQVTPGRAVFLHIAAHDISGACELLKKSHNYRLLLLVAQLDGADEAFMNDVKHQIDAWRDQKSLSEIDCDIRALYEVCAGNVSVSQGREGKTVPVEDRAETFHISTRFGLSWLQCFALGLFYGRKEKANNDGISRIEDAVREYQARCDRGEEPTKPPENDVMWTLLKLYASERDQDVSAPQFPAALEGLAKPWNHADLFTFQQAMQANLAVEIDSSRTDELAESFASELSTKGDIASAIYALIHISNAETRKLLIQTLLDRFAAVLPGADAATTDAGIALWQRLTMEFRVPTSWIYMSKARYAASTTNAGGDNVSELRYLVAAEAWDEAHECLLKRVAPSFIIDEDYSGLFEMCSLFGEDPERRVSGWYEGGEVFQSFGQLMTGTIAKTEAAAISALRKRLVSMGNKHAKEARSQQVRLGQLSQHELEEHVAIKEMANALARLAARGGSVGSLKEILELPITQDVRMEVVMGLGDGKVDDDRVKSTPASGKGRRRGKAAAVQSSPVEDDVMDEDDDHESGP